MTQPKLWGVVQEALPFLARRKSGPPRERLLALRPARSREIEWERKPDADPAPGAKLTVPRRDGGLRRVVARLLHVPPTRTVELDEFGAKIWERCDGASSVEQLVQFTCREYTLNRRQGEVSVLAFMRMLAQRGLIGFPAGGDLASLEKSKGDAAHGDGLQSGRGGRVGRGRGPRGRRRH